MIMEIEGFNYVHMKIETTDRLQIVLKIDMNAVAVKSKIYF